MKNKKIFVLFMLGMFKGLPMVRISHTDFELTPDDTKLPNARFYLGSDLTILPQISNSLGIKEFMLAECPTLVIGGASLDAYVPINNKTNIMLKIIYCQNTTFKQLAIDMLDLWTKLIFVTEDIPTDSSYITYENQVQKEIGNVLSSFCHDGVSIEYQDIIFLTPNPHSSQVRYKPY